MSERRLSEAEERAIGFLRENGGSVLQTDIENKNTRDIFGDVVPGISVYRKLAKLGLVIFCEPIIDDDGFIWTPTIDLNEETAL